MKTLMGTALLMLVISTIMLTNCFGIKNLGDKLIVTLALCFAAICLGRYMGRRLE